MIVTGSMTWNDAEAIRRELSTLPCGSTVIHGDAPGVDELAGGVARELGLQVEPWQKEEEDYRRYQQGAWMGLNERMLARGADLVLAFHPDLNDPDHTRARGSKHLIGLAQEQGIAVRRIT
jgi:hypothetical protein